MKSPETTFSGFVGSSGNFDKAVIKAERMPDTVLPSRMKNINKEYSRGSKWGYNLSQMHPNFVVQKIRKSLNTIFHVKSCFLDSRMRFRKAITLDRKDSVEYVWCFIYLSIYVYPFKELKKSNIQTHSFSSLSYRSPWFPP